MEFRHSEVESVKSAIYRQIDLEISHSQAHSVLNTSAEIVPGKKLGLRAIAERTLDLCRAVWPDPLLATVATLALITSVTAVLVLNNSGKPEFVDQITHMSELTLPQTLGNTSEKLMRHIATEPVGSRALLSTNRSDRYKAFETGVLIAHLQILDGKHAEHSSRLVKSYIDKGLAFTARTEGHNDINVLYETVRRLMQKRETRLWLQQGHIVESLYLTSILAMNDLNTDPVSDLLEHYRRLAKQTFYGDQNKQYIENHEALMRMTIRTNATPEDLASLTSTLRNLKVLAQ